MFTSSKKDMRSIHTTAQNTTVEPVLLHDVRQEAFDVVREVYAIRPGILALTEKFVRSLLCSFAGYAFRSR